MRKFRNLFFTLSLFTWLATPNQFFKTEAAVIHQNITIEADEIAYSRVIKKVQVKDPAYLENIPVMKDGETLNLYDLYDEDFAVYFKRDTCHDCQELGPVIIEKLKASGMPYAVISIPIKGQTLTDLSIEASDFKMLGLRMIPCVCTIKNGRLDKFIEEGIGNDGKEIAAILRN